MCVCVFFFKTAACRRVCCRGQRQSSKWGVGVGGLACFGSFRHRLVTSANQEAPARPGADQASLLTQPALIGFSKR